MLELEAIIKSSSPYSHFANFSDAEKVLSYLLKHIGVRREQGFKRSCITVHPWPTYSPHLILLWQWCPFPWIEDAVRICCQWLPWRLLSSAQFAHEKYFCAWAWFNNCLERGHKNCLLDLGEKMMIRSSGRYEKYGQSFIFWELISWKVISQVQVGVGRKCVPLVVPVPGLFPVSISLFFPECHIVKSHGLFRLTLPLKNVQLRLPQVRFPGLTAHLFSVLNKSQLCGCTSIYLFINWRMFGYFKLAVVNKAAITIHVQVLLWT